METIFDQHESKAQPQMTHHQDAVRSIFNLIASLLAFNRQTEKLSLHPSNKDSASLPTPT